MPFDLTIGTERAQALQDSIQDELQKRGFTPDADPTMAEYITIMLINNKTADQITSELEDLIGASEYDASFTDWLFEEAAKKSKPAPEPAPPSSPANSRAVVSKEDAPAAPAERTRPQNANRPGATPLYNQALNQALPSSSQTGQKRTASARSPSPTGHPHKSRRMDLPTGPRAMHGRESGNRSLLDRMGGRAQGAQRNQRDDIQARIDAVTRQNSMGGGFNNGLGMPGMPTPEMVAAMGGGMMNPMALQEMMMNQMALMAQMANSMGMLGQPGQMQGQNGFSPNPMMNNQNQNQQHQHQNQRRGQQQGQGRNRGDAQGQQQQSQNLTPAPSTSSIAAPTPVPAAQVPSESAAQPGFSPPERPQSPSLCKFGLKCTNALCRYSHPSPVATPESGVVLSAEACESGLDCKDKDCVKSHVSPSAVGVTMVAAKPKAPKPEPAALKPPCRYGANCTKVSSGLCPFSHPFVPKTSSQAVPCKFGAACTRADCHFQHPSGRVLPGSFHRGLSENGPNVNVPTPHTGSMGGRQSRSMVFNKPANVGDKPKEGNAGGESAPVEAAA